MRNDLTLAPCYICKQGNIYAHGETLREAQQALTDKMFEDMPEEDRLAAFVETHSDNVKYPNADMYDWHHRLTGSCDMGRREFAANHNISLTASMTVSEFIALCENAYGGSTIKKLKAHYGAYHKGLN